MILILVISNSLQDVDKRETLTLVMVKVKALHSGLMLSPSHINFSLIYYNLHSIFLNMKKTSFESALAVATSELLSSSQRLLLDTLPQNCRYVIRSREGGNAYTPTNIKKLPTPTGKMNARQIVESLFYKDKFPELIFMKVISIEKEFTIIKLFCSPTYSSLQDQIDHPVNRTIKDRIPFRIYLPKIPDGWLIKENGKIPNIERSISENGKFSL